MIDSVCNDTEWELAGKWDYRQGYNWSRLCLAQESIEAEMVVQ